ncbi:MAG TPA: thiolase family protein [Elusimicrobiota bacterium]|nr:thiolase family protein [Elusimicrobiota bacterium]
MRAESKKVVLCAGVRTPVGHVSRSLSALRAEDMLQLVVESLIARTKLPKDAVDGLMIGWAGMGFSAPNIARVTLVRCGLPKESTGVSFQNNCISSIEAISAAARLILTGEGELYIAGGTESMSQLPYVIDGSRSEKALRSLDTLKAKWGELWDTPGIRVVDSVEQGLEDPVERINMAGTAEVCAQMFGISREAQDAHAVESFTRTLAAWNRGFYDSHVVPAVWNGKTLLERDEYAFLREDVVAKPRMFAKVPLIFENSKYGIKDFYRDHGRFIEGKTYQEGVTKATVTLYNSCPPSDGAAALIVASEQRAKELGLEILGGLKGWGYYGDSPAHMDIAPALAAPVALDMAGAKFADLDHIELHEPFAASALAVFQLGKKRFGHDWQGKLEAGALNPNGSSLAIGHPLGATGARVMLNLLYGMKEDPKARLGLMGACAEGGMGGAMVVERYTA